MKADISIMLARITHWIEPKDVFQSFGLKHLILKYYINSANRTCSIIQGLNRFLNNAWIKHVSFVFFFCSEINLQVIISNLQSAAIQPLHSESHRLYLCHYFPVMANEKKIVCQNYKKEHLSSRHVGFQELWIRSKLILLKRNFKKSFHKKRRLLHQALFNVQTI